MNVPAVRRSARAIVFRIAVLACMAMLEPGRAGADGIKGTLEFQFTNTDTEGRSETGETTTAEATTFRQLYRLSLDRSIYPNLVLRTGGYFDKIDTTVDTAEGETDFTATNWSPFVDLILGTPLYSAAVGYVRRDEKLESAGTTIRLIRETYNSNLNWTPVDLPSVALRYIHSDTFDPGRVTENLTNETFELSSRYLPVKPLELTYQGTLDQSVNRIDGVETEDLTNSGRITYTDRFLKERISFHGNYDISHRRTETHAPGGGDVTVLVPAFAGLFALDDTPLEGTLPQAPALVNGELATGSPEIDIGLPAGTEPATPRNLGLDLQQLAAPDAAVNGLLVFVDRQLPDAVASSFQWNVYVSQNNLDWTFLQTVPSAPFGPFVNRFDVRFATVRTRYVKVVVAPLSPTVLGALSFPDIFVTELQATLTRPAAEVAGESSQTSHLVNVVAKTRLVDDPILYYDFSLLYARTYTSANPDADSRLLVSNGLSISRRLKPWLTANAQALREDGYEPAGDRVEYRYGASLSAIPLRTLSHSLVYSGARSTFAGISESRNAVFLSNRAMLYQGIHVFLNGGVSLAETDPARETRSYLANAGAEITPNRTLAFNLVGSTDRSEVTGGDRPDTVSFSRRGKASVSWNPAPAVSLFASAEVVEREVGKTTLYNWSLNWSPLRDGSLQASISANETIRPEEDGSDRIIVPSLRWQIRSGVYLDMSYAMITTKVRTAETDSNVFSTNLQANF